jgi:apolipoprotein N-acyltransferase
MALPKLAAATPGRVIVLPESIGGLWFEVPEAFWKEGLASSGDKTVLLGAAVGEGDGRSANILLSVTRTGSKVIYRQRMPVPLTMWRPWTSDGTHAYWFENPVVDVAGERAAVLICYEQVIVWPILFSMAGRPTVVVAIANDWWAGHSTIPAIQRNCVLAWCRLFGTPLVTATNT